MTYDNFTIKAQEAILEAQRIAGGFKQQTVDTPSSDQRHHQYQ